MTSCLGLISGLRAQLDKNLGEFNLVVCLSNRQSPKFNYLQNFPAIRHILFVSLSLLCTIYLPLFPLLLSPSLPLPIPLPLYQITEILDTSSICKIEDLNDESQIDLLTVRQLKRILLQNCIDYRGCVEKYELLDRVHRLWHERVDQKGKEDKMVAASQN